MTLSKLHGKAVAKSGGDVSLKLIPSTPRLNPSTDCQYPQDRSKLLSMSLMTLHLVAAYSFPASSLTQVSTPPLNVKPDRSPRNGLWSLPSRFWACFSLYPEQIPDSPCPFTGMWMCARTHTHTHTHTQDILSCDCKVSPSFFRHLSRYPTVLPDPAFKLSLGTPSNVALSPSTMLYFNCSFIFLNSQLPKGQNYVLLAITSLKFI